MGDLPRIRLGIHNNKMYLYAIQNKQGNRFNYREMYKLNKNVPSELTNMSQNFVYSMGIVISLMKYFNIFDLYMPYDLPFKFALKEKQAISDEESLNMSSARLESLGLKTKSQVKQIEKNMTEKFLNLAYRIKYHGSSISTNLVTPYMLDLSINHDNNEFNNYILEEIYNTLPKELNNKNSFKR